jgi:hypothetical protein
VHHHHLDRLDPPVLHATRLAPLAWAACLAGIIALAACAMLDGGASRAWSAVLAGMMVPLVLAVGSLAFLAMHIVCGARWVVPLQRVMEGIGAGLPLGVIAFLALGTLGLPYVYEWANPAVRDSFFRYPDGSKAAWMTELRWFITGALIVSAWVLLQRRLQRPALDDAARQRLVRWAVASLIVLVPSFTLFAWDTLLSLHVQWVSAIFGGYGLTIALHAFLGALALLVAWLSGRGLAPVARVHLRHDIGTWLVAFSCIVAYIAYVQYVIIAFANIDEETFWYLMRSQHGYGMQVAIDLVLRCLVPFALLMSQSLRARPLALGVAGASVLLGTWLHLHWLVMPAFSPNAYRMPFGPEFLVALGFLAGTFLLALHYWRRQGLVPAGDPRLLPAINAEHLH